MSKMLRLESAAAQLLSAPKIVRNDLRLKSMGGNKRGGGEGGLFILFYFFSF